MKRLMTLLLIVPLLQIVPVQSHAKMSCKQVTAQTKKLFEGEYKGDPDKAFIVLAQNIVKAYTLTLNNKGCFKKKEINGMLKGIRELKTNCENAKKDEMAWAIQKDICAQYPPLYKYIK
jgi:hypothetical protein